MRSSIERLLAFSAAMAACVATYGPPYADGAIQAATTSYCWQPPTYQDNLVLEVRSLVTSTGAGADQARSASGLLPDVADSVYVIGDNELCRRASRARALLETPADTTNLRPVLVVKAGTLRYAIDDGRSTAGEWRVAYVTDTTFSVVGGFVR